MKLQDYTSTQQLHGKTVAELQELATDIRSLLLQTVPETGGHLASNLGVVELTLALYATLPQDAKIVWDVGHQSYVHKILTGRKDVFSTLRQKGGISGFPDPAESANDLFCTGHSGTALSSAMGLASARDRNGTQEPIVAVLGDGSLTNGLTYEALNNLKQKNLMILLNDNGMSIAHNVGNVTRNLSKMRVGKRYLAWKRGTKRVIGAIPLLGKPLLGFGRLLKRSLKFMFLNNLFFENFNLKYLGPVDGHNLKDLLSILPKMQKESENKPVLLHLVTKKGKGYEPAEAAPEVYHGLEAKSSPKAEKTYSHEVGKTLCALAAENGSIAAVTAAMPDGTGLKPFEEAFPERFYDVGIAEEHAVTFAGGLAKGGVLPYVAVYSTFLQRAYDEILHDLCLQNAHVVLLADRSGFVGADGKTHQGLFGYTYLALPNLQIWTPCSVEECTEMVKAAQKESGVVCICYPRGGDSVTVPCSRPGQWLRQKEGRDCTLFAVGNRLVGEALQAAHLLREQGVDAAVVAVNSVYPLDEPSLRQAGNLVFTLEENMLRGGFGSAVASALAPKGVRVVSFGVANEFVPHGSVKEQLQACGLDAQSVAQKVLAARFAEAAEGKAPEKRP